MAVSVPDITRIFSGLEFGGVGFETPILLILIPIGIIALVYLLFIRSTEIAAPRKKRLILFATRSLILVLLVSGAAQPYTVNTKVTSGDPQVKMLV
ncbi:MAG: hypothetical protein SXQ77_05470, partial [Halobacteria archaeon]|nr:hypothetical protein [Halobacteria archaeon]